MSHPSIKIEIAELEKRLGLQPGFYQALLEEPSDWAFVIQLQVVVEASLTQALAETLGGDKVFEILASLNLQGRTGKLEFAKKLEILDAESQKIVETLAGIRNGFAHRLQCIGMTLEQYSNGLEIEKKLNVLRAIWLIEPQDEASIRKTGAPELGKQLRFMLWVAVGSVLLELNLACVTAEVRDLRHQAWKKASDMAQADTRKRLLDPVVQIADSFVPSTDTDKG